MHHIVIVEDEVVLAKVLEEKFRQAGFGVTLMANGDSAAAMTERVRKAAPDIVLLDLILPGKSGFEILQALKNDPESRAIPVMVFSVISEDENIKKALRIGAVDYFVKTQHSIDEVVERVKTYLTKQK